MSKPASFNVPLFKDIGKSVNDLLTRDFPNSQKFEVNTVSENGLKFQTIVEQKTEKAGDGSPQPKMFGSFQTKLDITDFGVSFTGTVDTEVLKWEVILSKLLKDGVKSTFKGATTADKIKELYGDFEYKTNFGNLVVDFNLKDNKPKFEVAAVVGQKGFTLGAKGSYLLPDDSNPGNFDGVVVSGGYATSSFDFTSSFNGRFENKKDAGLEFKSSIGSTLFYKYTPSTSFASNIGYDLTKSQLKDAVSVTVGGEHKFDDLSSVKGKIGTNGALALAYRQKLNKNLTLQLGTEVNVLKPQPHTVGFSVSFTP